MTGVASDKFSRLRYYFPLVLKKHAVEFVFSEEARRNKSVAMTEHSLLFTKAGVKI